MTKRKTSINSNNKKEQHDKYKSKYYFRILRNIEMKISVIYEN